MKPYHPPKLPIKVDYGEFARELADAQYAIGRLDGLHGRLPDPELLIAPLTTKEATVSSKIEGTQSTVSDVFLYEAGEKTPHPDVVEVANYKAAMLFAMGELKGKPLGLNLVKEVHKILLHNARRRGTPGEFRRDQVWVGREGAPIKEATYVPPGWESIPEYMDNLERYFHSRQDDILVRAALAHYQFEAIHPFNDGNGRIGRLLIPLIVYAHGKISQPILYMSGYFDRYKERYINTLHHVDETSDYIRWVRFFLRAITEQAAETQTLIEKILALHSKTQTDLEGVKSLYTSRLIDFIFEKPIFSTTTAVKKLRADRSTVLRLLDELIRRGVLSELRRKGRRRIFVFRDLVRLL